MSRKIKELYTKARDWKLYFDRERANERADEIREDGGKFAIYEE